MTRGALAGALLCLGAWLPAQDTARLFHEQAHGGILGRGLVARGGVLVMPEGAALVVRAHDETGTSTIVQQVPLPGGVLDMEAAGARVYTCGEDFIAAHEFQQDNTLAPLFVHRAAGKFTELTANERHLVAVSRPDRDPGSLHVLSIEDPHAPQTLHVDAMAPVSCHLTEDDVLFTGAGGVSVFRVESGGTLLPITQVESTQLFFALTEVGGRVYAGSSLGTLMTFDLAGGTTPTLASTTTWPQGSIHEIVAQSRRLFASSPDRTGVGIFNASAPAAPVFESAVATSFMVRGIAGDGARLFASGGEMPTVVEVASGASVPQFDLPGPFQTLIPVGDSIIGSTFRGLEVHSPNAHGHLDRTAFLPVNPIEQLALEGGVAVGAHRNFGLQLFDVSDLSDPRLVTILDSLAPGQIAGIENGLLYMVYANGVLVMDIGDPALPGDPVAHRPEGVSFGGGVIVDDSLYAVTFDNGSRRLRELHGIAVGDFIEGASITLSAPASSLAVQLPHIAISVSGEARVYRLGGGVFELAASVSMEDRFPVDADLSGDMLLVTFQTGEQFLHRLVDGGTELVQEVTVFARPIGAVGLADGFLIYDGAGGIHRFALRDAQASAFMLR